MSLPEQEARALERARTFLLALGSGETPVTGGITGLRAEARSIMKHYPIGAGERWRDLHDAQGGVMTPEQRTVVNEVIATHAGNVATHHEFCYRYHAGCLAHLLLRMEAGE